MSRLPLSTDILIAPSGNQSREIFWFLVASENSHADNGLHSEGKREWQTRTIAKRYLVPAPMMTHI
jgi:hypothetical protein